MKAVIPIVYFAASSFLSVVALNSPQSRRLILFPPLAALAILSFWHARELSPSAAVNNVWCMLILIWFAHISNILLLEETTVSSSGDGTTWNWNESYKIWNNPRRIGTSQQASNIQPRNKSNTKVSTRGSFLLRRLLSIIAISLGWYLHRYIFVAPHPQLYRSLTLDDVAPEKQIFLRRLILNQITGRETMIRFSVIIQWVWLQWAILTGFHDILSIGFVGILQFDDPDDWPPLFGNFTEVYTMRRFWSKFWHRIVYRTYLDYGALVLHILGIQRGSSVFRVLLNFQVFLFSGMIHAIVSWRMGFRCGIWEDIAWFCMNFIAIVLEDTVQQLLFGLLERCGWKGLKSCQVLWRSLGYMWVLCFFFWSFPKYFYPKMYCGMQ